MAVSYLNFEGVYDPKRTFAVTNWSDDDITVNWADPGPTEKGHMGDNFYTLHAGETKTYPQYLAYYITKIFVDREMFKDASKAPNNTDGSPSRQRERLEMAVVNADMRKPYEDKTIQEVVPGKESPEVTAMRAKIRKELIIEGKLPKPAGELSSEMNNNPDGSEKVEEPEGSIEFPDIPKKRGRPAKTQAEAAAGV